MRLIPEKNFPIISDGKLIRDHKLGFWVDGEKELTDPDGKLNAGAIDIKRIPGFSSNKIPESKREDLNIRIKSEFSGTYNSLWHPGENGLIPKMDHFTIDNTRKHYFIRIYDIDGYTEKYDNPNGNENTEYFFKVNIVHKPLLSNYWHFEFNIPLSDQTNLSKVKSAWQKLVCSSIRDKVQEVAKFKP